MKLHHEKALHFTVGPACRTLGEAGFFNLRVLIGLFVVLAGVLLALLGFGAFSAQAQQSHTIISRSTDPLVPAGFDCSRIHELGIDKQENMRAGAIIIACGRAQGGAASSPFGAFVQVIKQLLGVWRRRRGPGHRHRDFSQRYPVGNIHCE